MNDKAHYYTEIQISGEKRFVKEIPMSLYNNEAYTFQCKLIPEFTENFLINKIVLLVENYDTSNVTVKYEHINELEFSVDNKAAAIFGENIAKLHNYAFYHGDELHAKCKTDKYNNMDSWNNVENIDNDFLSFRHEIFNKTNSIIPEHPKITLHRDVRLHNIIFDGKMFHLIDFDYTAKDFVGIELAGFICDLVDKYDDDVLRTFLDNYISTNTFLTKTVYLNIIDSFILYLCTNTFPFYLKDNFTDEQYNEYVSQRTRRLKLITTKRDDINNLILKIYEGKRT